MQALCHEQLLDKAMGMGEALYTEVLLGQKCYKERSGPLFSSVFFGDVDFVISCSCLQGDSLQRPFTDDATLRMTAKRCYTAVRAHLLLKGAFCSNLL